MQQTLKHDRASSSTAKRVWERLRDEHGFTGAESTVRQWIRENGRPGEAQALLEALESYHVGAAANKEFLAGTHPPCVQ